MANTNRLIELFHAAKAWPAGAERVRYLATTCPGDPELQEQVLSLLQAEEGVGDFLQHALFPSPLVCVTEKAGDRIGRYRLLQVIGEGGCGVVYLAEQEEPVRRQVALKVIKLGMDTKQVVARFEAERQALALMDHPNIARILDGGATEGGRPYFVMELVKGSRLTDYCDQHNLSNRQRLDLFTQVCHAIQHAHQKGIIHRDLKPSNILVTLQEGVPVPKVIDFGIAKATDQRLTDKTLFTQLHQFLGTPAYMSPEQAELGGLDIDTRTDVYSLGVLLYELLTGRTPFDAKELLQAGFDEMRRRIREVEPPRPSTRVSTLTGSDLASLAGRCQSDPRSLTKLLHGDLDWIVMKALEKDRTRRYETANGFAMDIGRYLADEPVLAAAPSVGYRFGKFARRNKTALGVAAAFAVLLVVATAASTGLAIRAMRAEGQVRKRVIEVAAERDQKDQARQEAEAVSTYLTDVFRSPDPARNARTITVAEILERAAWKVDMNLTNQPARRAQLQHILGRTYHALGLDSEAIPLQEKARDFYRATSGPEHPATLEAMDSLARCYADAGRRSEALQLQEEVLALRRKVLGPEHPDTLTAMNHLAISYRDAGRLAEAPKLQEEVLRLRRKIYGSNHVDTFGAMTDLANSYDDAGRQAEALKLREEAMHLYRNSFDPEYPDALRAMNNLAMSYADAGRLDEALKMREEVLPLFRKVLGPEHPDTLNAINNLAMSCEDAGRREETLQLREEVLALHRKVHGPEHPATLSAMNNLSLSYRDAGRRDEALKVREEVLRLRRKVLGPEHPQTLRAIANLTTSYRDVGRKAEALQLQEEVLRLCRKVLGPEHPDTLKSMDSLAKSYYSAGRKEEAFELVDQLLPLRRKTNGPEHPETLNTLNILAQFHAAAGRKDEALKMQEEVLRLRRKVLGPAHPDTLEARQTLAASYKKAGREDQALKLEESAVSPNPAVLQVPSIGQTPPASSSVTSLDNQKYSRADFLYRRGSFAEAEPLYRQLLQSQLQRIPATNETALGISASLARNLAGWAWAERDSTNKAGAYDHAVEADRLLRDCLDARQRGTNATPWRTADVKSRLGFARLAVAVTDGKITPEVRAAQLAEAEPLLLESAAALQGEARGSATYKRDSLERLVRLYEAWPRPEQLATWRQKLEAFDKAEASRKVEAPKAGDK